MAPQTPNIALIFIRLVCHWIVQLRAGAAKAQQWLKRTNGRMATAVADVRPKDELFAPVVEAVKAYCQTSAQVVDLQSNAALKIDAAEYAFSKLLGDLDGVLRSSVSDWKPKRVAGPTEPHRLAIAA